jgi:hypothetical protein
MQWLRLAFSKGPNWLGVFSSPFTCRRKEVQFPKRRVSTLLNTRRWKSPKSSNSVWINLAQYPLYCRRYCRQTILRLHKRRATSLLARRLTDRLRTLSCVAPVFQKKKHIGKHSVTAFSDVWPQFYYWYNQRYEFNPIPKVVNMYCP